MKISVYRYNPDTDKKAADAGVRGPHLPGHDASRRAAGDAGLKAVGESIAIPLRYYDNNVAGTLVLLAAMEAHDVRAPGVQLVGHGLRRSASVPITEDLPLRRPTPTAAPSS